VSEVLSVKLCATGVTGFSVDSVLTDR
jgi:hypothetical protein